MAHNLVTRSTEVGNGFIELSLEESSMARPIDDEVLIEVRAAPISPFDMRLMIGRADPATAIAIGTCERPVTRLPIPDGNGQTGQRTLQSAHRLGAEGFGRVVDSGNAPAARVLLGHSVAAWTCGIYSRYCKARASDCLVLPASTPGIDSDTGRDNNPSGIRKPRLIRSFHGQTARQGRGYHRW